MSNPFLDSKRRAYLSQRTASAGADLTLVAKANQYEATFECAFRCTELLGNREFQSGDVPTFIIPFDRLSVSLDSLSKRFSVALVDYFSDENRSRFVLLVKIPKIGKSQDGTFFSDHETASQDGTFFSDHETASQDGMISYDLDSF